MYWYDLMWGNRQNVGNGYLAVLPWGEAIKRHLISGDNRIALDPTECEIMQFTGLSDKAGNEVYEGDYLGGYPHGTVVVKWDAKFGCFTCYDAENNEDYGVLGNEFDSCADSWEVTGNIHNY